MPPLGASLRAPLGGETMGTRWSLSWCAPATVPVGGIKAIIETVFSMIIMQMSTWEPGSQISRYNRLAPGEALSIGDDFAAVLALALDIARRSHGAFDPALGAEVARRGFGAQAGREINGPALKGPAAWASLEPESGRLIQPGGLHLDLSAIAKGYAVDRMVDALAGAGVTQCLCEIGGEFAGRGVRPGGLPWWVDIEGACGAPPARIALCGLALATSGGHRQSRPGEAGRVSHIVPAGGAAADDAALASVSVLHESCAAADAWATALFAAGRERGAALADAMGLAALFQGWDGEPLLSDAAARMLD